MFCICVLIVAAAAVYMVEAYIHTYYAIEYMHGAPLFFVLLAKYAAPVLFLLLCGYFVFRHREKHQEPEKPAQEKLVNREEAYAEKINAIVKTKAVFSDQADQIPDAVSGQAIRTKDGGGIQHDPRRQDFRRTGKMPDAVGIVRTDIL